MKQNEQVKVEKGLEEPNPEVLDTALCFECVHVPCVCILTYLELKIDILNKELIEDTNLVQNSTEQGRDEINENKNQIEAVEELYTAKIHSDSTDLNDYIQKSVKNNSPWPVNTQGRLSSHTPLANPLATEALHHLENPGHVLGYLIPTPLVPTIHAKESRSDNNNYHTLVVGDGEDGGLRIFNHVGQSINLVSGERHGEADNYRESEKFDLKNNEDAEREVSEKDNAEREKGGGVQYNKPNQTTNNLNKEQIVVTPLLTRIQKNKKILETTKEPETKITH